MRKRLLKHCRAASCLLAVCAGVAFGQSERFEDSATVVVVEVPVQVVHRGEPVRGLEIGDFEVRENGRMQEIVGFEVVDLAVAPAPAADDPVPRLAARRNFLLLFDLSFSGSGSIVKAQQAARQLTLDALHPTDLVGVALYTASRGAELVLGFTTDRQQLEWAIENLRLPESARHFADPLSLVITDTQTGPGASVGTPGPRGAGANKAERFAALEQQIRDLEPLALKAARNQKEQQVLALTSSLEQLANVMNNLPGKKHVVMLSEGFDSSVLVGTEDFSRIEEMATDAVNGESWRIDSEERFGSSIAKKGLSQMVEAFRRADCTIQAVDIGGARAGADIKPRASGENGLFIMADQTGGELFRNYNDLGEAMDELLDRSSVTYLLAIQPDSIAPDGSFHRLKVKLRGGPKGARLLHRPGFYAPRPFTALSGEERRLNAAGLIIGGREGGELVASVLATPVPLGADRSYVPLLVEIDGERLLGDDASEILPLEIYAYAIDQDGAVQDFSTQALALDRAKVGTVLAASGFKFWGHLDLPAGDYVLRVLVRNARTGSTVLRLSPLRVPVWSDHEAVLLPPLVPEPSGKWLIGQEAGERPEVAYPFVIEGKPFVPAAKPLLAAGQDVDLALMAYNLNEETRRVSAELRAVGKAGNSGQSVPYVIRMRESGAGQGLVRLIGSLESREVPAGHYELVISLAGADGAERTSTIPVEVRG
ncbi:MAG: VWA domain-containing protein [Thermoanaerobaculia bacterium]